MSLAEGELERAATDAYQRGKIVEAEQLCRQALAADPRDYRCLILLAALLREKRELGESAAVAERAMRLRPGMVEAYYQLALTLLEAGKPEPARKFLTHAIQLRPEIPVFHLQLGIALEATGRRADAKKFFQSCLRLDPSQLQARVCLAAHLLIDDEVMEARTHAEAALATAPYSVAAHLALADVALAEGEGAAADRLIARALELDSNSVASLNMLGFRQSELGRFPAAEAAFRRSIEAQPAQGLAYLGLSQTGRLTEASRRQLAQAETVLRDSRLSPVEASSLHFALAKGYGELGQYQKSMESYDEAQRLASNSRFGRAKFDEQGYAKSIAEIRRTFSPAFMSTPWNLDEKSDLPILIVGMIRSGTTLTEQILSCHTDVGAAGEHRYWKTHGGRVDALSTLAFNPTGAARVAAGYVDALQMASPSTKHVTDKLPGNYLRLGLIQKALPNARIIHCRRSPLDTAFSIYTTPNRLAPSFSHAKEAIVFAYRQYLDLMAHWRALLPASRFLEVDYEELVEDPQPTIRRMLAFCGLEWQEACLYPERNPNEVATPSLWQVRQPIYRSSVKKWINYAPWLGALGELRDLG